MALAACAHEPPPVPPGEPIPAEPDLEVGTMDEECTGLVAAIQAYGDCPNADDDLRAWAKRAGEVAQDSFDAGKIGKPDAQAQHVMALACRKAEVSLHNAALRCANGPRPKAE